jgi:hypothetical protein
VTDTPQELEALAERIAARGPDALLTRLREAFAEAARTHSDLVTLDAERIEELVQRSAGQADGLQWRRALAGVTCEELGIGLGEALHHPAVQRAQEIAGAPSYEEGLAELSREPIPDPEGDDMPAEPDGSVELEERWEDEAEVEELEEEEQQLEAEVEELEVPETLRFSAVHLGGVADLEGARPEVDLILSEDGLDIMLDKSRILGRLAWSQIRSLDVPAPRGRRRRRVPARLIVRTRQGDVSFEVPAQSAEELRGALDPLASRFIG